MQRFNDKVIVITGATAGLGRALVKAFANYPCHIAGLGRRSAALDSLGQEIADKPAKYLPITCDVSNKENSRAAFDKIFETFGKVDVLINNAGITNISLFGSDSHVDIAKEVMDTNYFGMVNCTASAINSIKTNRGAIINISSVAGYSPLVGRTAYSASKHAMHGFSNSLRAELIQHGVQVMVVCPTFIQTEIRSNGEQQVQGETLTPEYTALRIIKGIEKGKRLLLIGKTAIFAYWMNKLFPVTYERIMINNQLAKVKGNP